MSGDDERTLGAPRPRRSTRQPRRQSRLTRLRRPAADKGTSRLGSRRPLPEAAPRNRRTTLLLAAVIVVVAVSAIASFVVLPLQNYFAQGDEITQLEAELARLSAITDDLRAEVSRLRTDTGIEEAAKDQLGYVTDGDTRQTVLNFPDLPTDLPVGWPYGLIDSIASVALQGN